MKPIKTLGLAAITALAAMAFVGTSAAMGGSSLLCANDTEVLSPTLVACAPPEAVHYVSVKVTLNEKKEEITEGAKAIILSSLINVECNVLLAGTVEDRDLVSAHPLHIRVTEEGVSYTNCTNNCVVTATGADFLLLKTAVELGNLTEVGYQISLTCMFIKCTFNMVGSVGHFLGALQGDTGGKGHITYNKVRLPLQSGAFCPSEAFLDLLLQSLNPIYIRA